MMIFVWLNKRKKKKERDEIKNKNKKVINCVSLSNKRFNTWFEWRWIMANILMVMMIGWWWWWWWGWCDWNEEDHDSRKINDWHDHRDDEMLDYREK